MTKIVLQAREQIERVKEAITAKIDEAKEAVALAEGKVNGWKKGT